MRLAPLSGAFTLVSIVGFLFFSIYTMYGRIDKTWGFTMMLFFFMCVVAAYISIYPTFYKNEIKNIKEYESKEIESAEKEKSGNNKIIKNVHKKAKKKRK